MLTHRLPSHSLAPLRLSTFSTKWSACLSGQMVARDQRWAGSFWIVWCCPHRQTASTAVGSVEVRGGSVRVPSEDCCTLQVVDDWDKGEDVEPRVQHLSLERTAPKNPNGTSTQAENFVLFMCLGIRCQYHKKVVCCDTAENVRKVWACRADDSTTCVVMGELRLAHWPHGPVRFYKKQSTLSTVLQNLTK